MSRDSIISNLSMTFHLNPTACIIKSSPGKGRGVYASKPIPRNTLVEISPVLLFSKEEYQNHGKYTVLDHYTFVWPDGRMALALGLGSLFNHFDPPNVSFTIDTSSDSIRYTSCRDITEGEELCIFYGHNLWFSPVEAMSEPNTTDTLQKGHVDEWGGLSTIDFDDVDAPEINKTNPFSDGDPEELLSEEDLPFIRYKLPPEEEQPDTIRTIQTWVVDVPDQRLITTLLKWLKQNNLDTTELAHLKRVRKHQDHTTFLLASQLAFPSEAPTLPLELCLPLPYLHKVPASSALTPIQLSLKTALWPTMFTPRRKDEPEKWSRGKAAWAWTAMQKALKAAREAEERGELPIVAHIPPPYEEVSSSQASIPEILLTGFTGNDTRNSSNHPLRHAAINAVRMMADYRASESVSISPATIIASGTETNIELVSGPISQNGNNYLLTSLTVFVTHEPCVMCSMALLHSRVKEVIYYYEMPQTGGCGSGAVCLPTLKGVNHRYAIARWKRKTNHPSEKDEFKVLHDDITIDIDPRIDA